MTEIIILGADNNIEDEIISYFSSEKSVVISKNSVCVFGYDNLVLNNIPYYETKADIGIVIILSLVSDMIIPEKFTAICESTNTPALEQLLKNENNTITVGMKPTDTLTFSSIGEKRCQISLQRNITDINGKTIVAGDYSFKRNCTTPQAELICTAVKLITNK